MVSKNELKKRMQKRAKKAAAASSSRNSTLTSEGQGPTNAPSSKPAKAEEFSIDSDAMFNQGFLAEVYRLRPSKDVVTRFPPEPNGYLHVYFHSSADFLHLPSKLIW